MLGIICQLQLLYLRVLAIRTHGLPITLNHATDFPIYHMKRNVSKSVEALRMRCQAGFLEHRYFFFVLLYGSSLGLALELQPTYVLHDMMRYQ